MKLDQLHSFLKSADGSVPKLNNQLSLLIGYTRVPNPDPSAKKKARWYDPDGNEVTAIPDYTGSIDAARIFLEALVPVQTAGFAERHDGVFAQVNEEAPVQGSTPALAMCLAGLSWRLARGG